MRKKLTSQEPSPHGRPFRQRARLATGQPKLYSRRRIANMFSRIPLQHSTDPIGLAQPIIDKAIELFMGKSCLIRYTGLTQSHTDREAFMLKADIHRALLAHNCPVSKRRYNIQFLNALLTARDLLRNELTGNCYTCKHAIGNQDKKEPSAFCARYNKPLPPAISTAKQEHDFVRTLMSKMIEPTDMHVCFETPQQQEILHRIAVCTRLIEKLRGTTSQNKSTAPKR